MSGAQAGARVRVALRIALSALYGAAGLAHLVATDRFLAIVPDWVPQPRLVVLATGLCEIAGAIALCTARYRRLAGLALALYAICVFPANLKHALAPVSVPPIPDSWWYHGPRLALQPVLVWAALLAGGLVAWPFRQGPDDASGPRVENRDMN